MKRKTNHTLWKERTYIRTRISFALLRSTIICLKGFLGSKQPTDIAVNLHTMLWCFIVGARCSVHWVDHIPAWTCKIKMSLLLSSVGHSNGWVVIPHYETSLHRIYFWRQDTIAILLLWIYSCAEGSKELPHEKYQYKHHCSVYNFKDRHFQSSVKGNEFLYKLICCLPSRTVALQELSMSVGRLEPRHPLRHMIALRRRAKLIFVRMYVIASEYDSSFFSAVLLAICFIVRVADGPAPPMHENAPHAGIWRTTLEIAKRSSVRLVFSCMGGGGASATRTVKQLTTKTVDTYSERTTHTRTQLRKFERR